MWRYLFLQQVDVSPHKDDLSFSIREEASRRRKKERGRKLRRYLLIGLATLGGGTVIGDYSCFRISKSPESNDNQLIIKSTKTKEKLSEFSSWHIVALTSFCILYWLIFFFFSFARCDRWAGSPSGGSRCRCCAGGWRCCCSGLGHWHCNYGLSVRSSRGWTDR